jgi:hypothetical protein
MLTTVDKVDTTIISDIKINEPVEAEMGIAALWVCDQCQVWWGSQNSHQPEARHLLQMAEPNTHLFKWEDYRGWREKGAENNTCPDCGRVAPLPRLNLFAKPAQIQAA